MNHRHVWSKAVSWEGDDPPNGFDRTLPPSDPRTRSGAPAAGYAVRDNRRQVVDAQTPPAPAFAEIPVSGVRPLLSSDRLRAGIPVARITRDPVEAPSYQNALFEIEQDTWLDTRREPDPVMELTPDFASEYVPPQPLPEVAQHKTFELRPVRLSPEIHPRTAPTILNARAIKRRDDKQQKDAREIAALLAQAHRRRRVPWIAVAFLLVVGLGFVIGVELADSSAAGAEVESEPIVQTAGAAVSTPAAVKPGAAAAQAPVARALEPAAAAPAPATAHLATQTRSVAKASVPASATDRTAKPASKQTRPQPLPRPSDTPVTSEPTTVREVWLR
jgi:hypothetical protein